MADDIVDLRIQAQNLASDALVEAADDTIELGRQADKTQKELDNLEVTKRTIDSFKDAEARIESLTNQVADAKVRFDELSKEQKKNKNVSSDQRKELELQKRTVENLTAELRGARSEYQNYGKQLRKSKVNTDDLAESERDLANTIERTGKEVTRLNAEYAKRSQRLKQSVVAEQKVADALREQEKATAKLTAEKQKQAAIDVRQENIEREKAAELERVTNALQDYERELNALNLARERGEKSTADIIRKEADLRKQLKLTAAQVSTTKSALQAESDVRQKILKDKENELRIATRKAASDAKEAAEAKRITAELVKYEKRLEQLNNEKERGELTTGDYIRKETALRKELKLTSAQVAASKAAIQADVAERNKATRSTDALTNVTRRLAQAYTVLIAAQQATQGVLASVKAYSEYESALVGVERTTGLAADEVAKLGEEILDLSKNVTPTATSELLKYAQVAGQLGVKSTADILKLVAAADQLGVSTNIAGDEAITLLTRILNVTNEGVPNINRLASSVVSLGNDFEVTESELVNFARQVVTSTRDINLSSAAAAALGTALAASGQQAEASRTAIGRLAQTIKRAATTGGKSLKELSDITELTGNQIQESLGSNQAEKVILAFAKGLDKARDSGRNTIDVLRQFGIDGQEAAAVIGSLASQTEVLERAIKTSNEAYSDGTKQLEEAAKAFATQESAIGRLANKFTDLKRAIGESLADETKESIEGIGGVIEDVESKLIDLVDGVSTTFRDVIAVASELDSLIGSIGTGLPGTTNAIQKTFALLSVSLNGFSNALNTISLGMVEARIKAKEFLNSFSDNPDTSGLDELRAESDRIKAKIEQNTRDVQASLRVLSGESTRAYEDFLAIVDGNSDAIELLGEDQKKLVKLYLNTADATNINEKSLYKLTAQIVKNIRELEIQEELRKAELATQKESAKESEKVTEAKEKELTALEQLNKSLKDGKLNRDEYIAAVRKLVEENSNAGDSAKQLAKDTQSLTVEQASVAKEIDDLSTKMSTYSDEIIAAGANIDKLAIATNKYNEAEAKHADLTERQAELNKINNATRGELVSLLQSTNLELGKLNNQFAAGSVSAGEYSEKSKILNDRIALLTSLVGDSVGAIGEQTKSLDDNTAAQQRNAAAAADGVEATKGRIAAAKEWVAQIRQSSAPATSMYAQAANYLKQQFNFTGQSAESLRDRVTELNVKIGQAGRVWNVWWRELAKTYALGFKREKQIIQETLALEKYIKIAESGNASLAQLNRLAIRANYEFKELGDNELDKLRNAIRDATGEIQDLNDEIDSTLDDTLDRLDEVKGNQEAIISRQNQIEREEIESLISQARLAGDEAAIRRAELALKNLKEAQRLEALQRKQQNSDVKNNNSSDTIDVRLTLPDGSTQTVQVSSADDAAALMNALSALGQVSNQGGI